VFVGHGYAAWRMDAAVVVSRAFGTRELFMEACSMGWEFCYFMAWDSVIL
jgi:hypothetical protein